MNARWVRMLALGLALSGGAFSEPVTSSRSESSFGITSIAHFWSLSEAEIRRGLPVHLEGIVLYEDPDWGLLFIQDDTGTLFTELPRGVTPFKVGDRVRLTGVTAWVQTNRRIDKIEVKVTGSGVLPPPARLSWTDLTNRTASAQRVVFEGVVREAEPLDAGRGRLILDAGRARIQAFLREANSESLIRIRHARVQVVGLRVPAANPKPGLAPVDLLVRGLEDVLVLMAMSQDPFQAPVTSIRSLVAQFRPNRPQMLQRVQGLVRDQIVGRSFWLEDGTGRIEIRSSHALVLTNGTRLEVVGYPNGTGSSDLWLEEVSFRIQGASRLSAEEPVGHVFQFIQEIRALTPEQAATRRAVSVEAVVTYHDPNWRVLFIQQGDSGIFVNCGSPPDRLEPGDRVRVEGVTGPGGYAPIIDQARVTRLGQGGLPEPVRPSETRLFSGLLDSTWAELQARIQTVKRMGPNLELTLATRRGSIQAWLPDWSNEPAPENWVGLEVRARGVVGSRFNALRQLTGVTLHVPKRTYLEFLEPVPEDPWDRPVMSIRQLLTASSGRGYAARARIQGVVTYASTNGWIAIQDHTAGLWLELPSEKLHPGQKVELLGFPAAGSHGPTLEHPAARITGTDALPAPVRAAPEALLSGELEAQRVTVEGTLIENHTGLSRPYFLLDDSGTLIHVYLPADSPLSGLTSWKPGSRLAATGVVRTQRDESGRGRAVRIMVNSPREMQMLAAPPWLTKRHLALIGGAAAVVAVLALAWGCMLRHKVQTQTRAIQEQLRREQELKKRYEDLFENAGDLILILDTEGRIIAVNRAAEKAFGEPRTALAGRLLSDFLHTDDRPRFEEALQRLRAGRSGSPFEVRLKSQDGKERVWELNLQSLQCNGSKGGFECIARDQSERRQLESQMRQMQRLESVGQLAAGVAHDYNNIMTVILGHTGMLLQEGNLAPAIQESLHEIQRAATRAADLTRQLLAFSRKQVMKARPINLNEVVTDMSKMLRRLLGEHIELQCQLDPALSLIQADVAMIEQVIVNLAVNARDAMPHGGKLTIRTERTEVSPEHLKRSAEAAPGRHVCLAVSDTGTGMDAETLQHIFEPFFTTKPFGKGSGLGLSTVYGIVKQHNGWIEVESQPGRGSTFRVFFPATGDAAKPVKASKHSPVLGGHETILAVEDEPALRSMLVNGLRRLGYQVLAASNGIEALQLWQTHRNQIDLLITDMVMPGGLNGKELADRLRAEQPDLKVIFSSGYSPELFDQGVNHLPGAFLPKPFTPAKLAATVRTCLDGKQTPATIIASPAQSQKVSA
ncbi:MAG: ATP-binding protein [Verrucomicrobiota bacterium]|nr:ATP-binding protein [Limisphaera sp.]MDW8380663.1 ATP-binding protein [Verrucomicrobiota bacterium]